MNDAQQSLRVLVVDDEEKIRSILSTVLSDAGYEVATAADGFEALEKSASFRPQVVIVDLQMPRLDGIETINKIREVFPDILSIVLTAHGSIATAVRAIRNGAYDYLTKPYDNEQLLLVVHRAMELYRISHQIVRLKEEAHERWGIHNLLGQSAKVNDIRSQILKISDSEATVLIEGASGTGKELAARAIHHESKRRGNPLVIIDCAAIAHGLIESEFFGHERGSFTDARERRAGKFEEANSGSVFLDEIGELPPEAQTRLLRVLQEREFTRVGGSVPIEVNVRIIAATNRDLEAHVREGKFREDLFHRLNVIRLCMPSLQEHREDIPIYVRHFLQKHKHSMGRRVDGVSEPALGFLASREWPGNVREVENAVQRALMNAKGRFLELDDFGFLCGRDSGQPLKFRVEDGLEPYIKELSEDAERKIIVETLRQVGFNRTEAALRLKISRKTLFNKMEHLGIDTFDDK